MPNRPDRSHPRIRLLLQWRWPLTALQLGPRLARDPAAHAIRRQHEQQLLLRAEVSALLDLLRDKRVITEGEWYERLEMAAEDLDRQLRAEYPGCTPTRDGMRYAHGAVPWRRLWHSTSA